MRMGVDAPITVTLSSLDMTAASEPDWPFALAAPACNACVRCPRTRVEWSEGAVTLVDTWTKISQIRSSQAEPAARHLVNFLFLSARRRTRRVGIARARIAYDRHAPRLDSPTCA